MSLIIVINGIVADEGLYLSFGFSFDNFLNKALKLLNFWSFLLIQN